MTPADEPPGEDHCDCSVALAAEFHDLADALAAEHGVDLCHPSDEDLAADDDDDIDLISALRLFHDLSIAHGATCDSLEDDEPDEPA